MAYPNLTCWDVCKMSHPCGNVHCSANPNFVGQRPAPRRKKSTDIYKQQDKMRKTLIQKGVYGNEQ